MNRRNKPQIISALALQPLLIRTKISDCPTATTTIFEFISQGPMFHFWGIRGPNAPSTQWNTEKPQRFFIWCAIKCRFGVASDAKLFWKIMVVVVFGPLLKKKPREKQWSKARSFSLRKPLLSLGRGWSKGRKPKKKPRYEIPKSKGWRVRAGALRFMRVLYERVPL